MKKNVERKTIMTAISIVAGLLICNKTNAQDALKTPEMKAYYEYCLDIRKGVENVDRTILEKCQKAWNNENTDGIEIKQNDVSFIISDTREIKEDKDTPKQSMKGHMEFTPMYVDSLLAYDLKYINSEVEEPEQSRGGMADCFYEHKMLPAKSKMTYRSTASGDRELFVVTENGGLVNMVVTIDATKQKYSKKSKEGFMAPALSWTMDYGTYTIDLENKSNKDISIIIVTN